MRRLSLLLALVLLGSARHSLDAAEETALFDGQTLKGWTWRGPRPDAENPFSVADGVLRCAGRPAGYLRTDQTYTSFVLKLQWRWPKESKPGNNGVLLRSQEGEHFFGNVWPKSIEAQLAHEHAGDIFTIGEFPLQTGRNQGRYTPKMNPSNERPQGEWNDYEIRLEGEKLRLVVNGAVQNEGTAAGMTPGFIGLQSEGAPIEYRNICLQPLDE